MAGPLTIPIAAAAGTASGFSLGSLGSILSGIGAVGGLFEGKSDGIDVSENVRLHKHVFDQKMASLKKHGIHPLFGLGAPGAQGPGVIAGQSDRGGRAADKLAQAGQAMMAYESHKRSLQESQARERKDLMQADLFSAEADAARLRMMQGNPQNDVITDPPMAAVPFTNPWTGETVWLPNTKAGFEMGEALGTAEWARVKAAQELEGQPKHYKEYRRNY